MPEICGVSKVDEKKLNERNLGVIYFYSKILDRWGN